MERGQSAHALEYCILATQIMSKTKGNRRLFDHHSFTQMLHSSEFLFEGQVKLGQFSIQHFPSCFNEISQG